MRRDVLRRGLEQLGDPRLSQPQRFVLEPALDARAAILGLVKNECRVSVPACPYRNRPRFVPKAGWNINRAAISDSRPVYARAFGCRRGIAPAGRALAIGSVRFP